MSNKKYHTWMNQLYVGNEHAQVANPYSGESVELEPIEIAVYDFIKGCEATGMWDEFDEAIVWFRNKNPSAYMTLLD